VNEILIVLLLLLVLSPVLAVALSSSGRARFLRGLVDAAQPALERRTTGMFEGATTVARHGDEARIEGTYDGEPLAVRAAFPAAVNARYLRLGYKAAISAELAVTVGLRGASPRFALVPTARVRDIVDEDGTPTEGAFARGFTVDVEPDLALDDALRAEIASFVRNARSIRCIRVGPDGLTIAWAGDGGVVDQVNPKLGADARSAVDRTESDNIGSAARLATSLRRHVLAALDRRAHPHVRVAYRAPDRLADPMEEEAQPDATSRRALR
jgi:hypothetical protein